MTWSFAFKDMLSPNPGSINIQQASFAVPFLKSVKEMDFNQCGLFPIKLKWSMKQHI